MNEVPDDQRLLRRMQAADPAADQQPPEGWLDDLLEDTMSNPVDAPDRRSSWVPLAAAAVVAVLVLGAAGAGVLGIFGGDDDPGTVASPPTVLELTAPAEDPSMMCAVFSVETLAQSPVAFAGTAVEVGDDVLLRVDQWYAGGDADQVRVAAPDADAVPLLGAVRFVEGDRYLVAADRGAVSPCGLSGEWSQELEDSYEKAFAGRS